MSLSVEGRSLLDMRKIIFFLLTASLVCSVSSVPAQAATQTAKYIKAANAFNTVLSASTDSLDALDAKYQAALDALDASLTAATNAADKKLQEDLASATALYAPQIASANKTISDAKVQYLTVNQVKIINPAFGELDRINWALQCPDTRLPNGPTWLEIAKRYCANDGGYPRPGDKSTKGAIGSTVGGEDWQPGDVTTISIASADDKYVQLGIAAGVIAMVNQAGFDAVRLSISSATRNVADLTTKYGNARTDSQSKRDNSVAAAKQLRDSSADSITKEYELAKEKIQAQIDSSQAGLLAAQRASKDGANFDKAFTVAYQFEFNRTQLSDLADTPWSGVTTFKAIDSLIKVTRLSIQADAIANKYSTKTALAFNNALGNAFVNDVDFRASLKLAIAIYTKGPSGFTAQA